MSDKSYPIHFKKIVSGQVETRYAHNKTEEEKIRAEGFIDQESSEWQRQQAPLFPCLMYTKAGVQVRCENQEHQTQLLESGHSVKPIIAKAPAGPAAPVSAESNSRLDAVEGAIADLQEGMKQILAALTEPKKGKKDAA